MAVFKEVIEKLQTSAHPVARILTKNEDSKTLVIGFKQGMQLKEHITPVPAKLIVVSGKVVYSQENQSNVLHMWDEIEIPPNMLHAVTAEEDSMCLLIQGLI